MKHLTTPLLALVLLLLAQLPAAGQTTLALTGGVNIASVDVEDEAEAVPDFLSISRMSVGLTADFALSDRFGIQLGGRYAQKGGGLDLTDPDLAFESSVELDYLEFTALGRLRFPLAGDRVFVNLLTGPAVAMETGCGLSAKGGADGTVLEYEEECDDVDLERSSIDIGWVAGGGLDIGITGSLSASPGILYTHGLVDIDTTSGGSLRNRAVTLQVGLAYAIR